MLKGSDVLGSPVIAYDTGKRVDTIHDLIVSRDGNTILGFVIDKGGWSRSTRVLPFESIQGIGPNGALVANETAIVATEEAPRLRAILDEHFTFKGKKVMTLDGNDLGAITDVFFDGQTGHIHGYEVSGGLFADLQSGRSYLPSPDTIKFGEEYAFVPPDTAEMMDEQVGGLRAALQSAGEKISEMAEAAGEKLREAGAVVAEKAEEVTQRTQEAVAERVVPTEEQRQFALGKTVERDIKMPDDTLVLAAGGEVTEAVLDQAEAENLLHEVYQATGGSIAHEMKQAAQGVAQRPQLDKALHRRATKDVCSRGGLFVAAQGQIVDEAVIERAKRYHREKELLEAVGLDAGEETRQEAGSAVDRVKEGATRLWDRATGAVEDATERGGEAMEERRIRGALGRPVTRVILDPQDQVILNTGDLITHQAVNRAREAGVLDILLDSVYSKDPDLGHQPHRAPQDHGDAALEHRGETAQMGHTPPAGDGHSATDSTAIVPADPGQQGMAR